MAFDPNRDDRAVIWPRETIDLIVAGTGLVRANALAAIDDLGMRRSAARLHRA
jgi:hypothetical protein